jgi:hypothetical protein
MGPRDIYAGILMALWTLDGCFISLQLCRVKLKLSSAFFAWTSDALRFGREWQKKRREPDAPNRGTRKAHSKRTPGRARVGRCLVGFESKISKFSVADPLR